MTSYVVKNGDTFASIARRVYGDDVRASEIRKANPGVNEPLQLGAKIIIPTVSVASGITEGQDNEIAIKIEGKEFKKWTNISLTKSVDSIDTLEILVPFDPDNKDFRELFKPFSYKEISVFMGTVLSFKGRIVDINPSFNNNVSTVTIGAYSLPGVLSDCTFPASKFPLEFDKQNLQQIASSLVGSFGFKAVFENDPGAVFDRVAVEPDRNAFDFLTELAKQRDLIITNNDDGDLVFKKVEVGAVELKLEEGTTGIEQLSASFGPQQYYSHITGLQPAVVGIGGSQYTSKNTKLTDVLRPYNFKIDDASDGDAEKSCNAKLGRMFGDAVSYTLVLASWSENTKLWKPGDTVSLIAPKAMIYSETKFLIREVNFRRVIDSETATLTLVLPGSYSGEVPEVLPWEE